MFMFIGGNCIVHQAQRPRSPAGCHEELNVGFCNETDEEVSIPQFLVPVQSLVRLVRLLRARFDAVLSDESEINSP